MPKDPQEEERRQRRIAQEILSWVAIFLLMALVGYVFDRARGG